MTDPVTLSYSDLAAKFADSSILFVGRVSFEDRSAAAYKSISGSRAVNQIFFASADETLKAKEIRLGLEIDESRFHFLDTHDPIQTQKCIVETLRRVTDEYFDRLLIDITTFRREELLILLSEIRSLGAVNLQRTTFIYSKAGSMAKWLSGSIREVRSVIGYPGEIDSLKKTHLIIMSGIELNRAKAIIEAYEPFSVSLGMVPEDESVLSSVYRRNLELRNFLTRHFDQISSEFDFSASNVSSIKDLLKRIVADLDAYNIVLAPLNTKMSTLAAGAVAQENPKIQLCYAEVDIYNSDSYSTAGSEVLTLEYCDLYI